MHTIFFFLFWPIGWICLQSAICSLDDVNLVKPGKVAFLYIYYAFSTCTLTSDSNSAFLFHEKKSTGSFWKPYLIFYLNLTFNGDTNYLVILKDDSPTAIVCYFRNVSAHLTCLIMIVILNFWYWNPWHKRWNVTILTMGVLVWTFIASLLVSYLLDLSQALNIKSTSRFCPFSDNYQGLCNIRRWARHRKSRCLYWWWKNMGGSHQITESRCSIHFWWWK